MKTIFKKLNELERARKITIGMNRNHANNFWYHQTVIGKILNWLTYVLIILAIITFIKFGFLKGILATFWTGIYTVVVQKISSMYVRVLLLRREELFDVAYQEKSITIRNNYTGKIFFYPTDWKKEITEIR